MLLGFIFYDLLSNFMFVFGGPHSTLNLFPNAIILGYFGPAFGQNLRYFLCASFAYRWSDSQIWLIWGVLLHNKYI